MFLLSYDMHVVCACQSIWLTIYSVYARERRYTPPLCVRKPGILNMLIRYIPVQPHFRPIPKFLNYYLAKLDFLYYDSTLFPTFQKYLCFSLLKVLRYLRHGQTGFSCTFLLYFCPRRLHFPFWTKWLIYLAML